MSALAATRAAGRVPVAPSMQPALEALRVPVPRAVVDGRVVGISGVAIALGACAALVARILGQCIALVTNLAFHARLSLAAAEPAGHRLGPAVIAVPVIGGLVVGVMARYGSAAIRGHGIPEAMERVLFHESRIPTRITFLKPLSAAIAIGTGGPFGAEGPIIATGGALGSFLGQRLHVSADERKTLLAAGAAAGMSATFATPVSAVLLAIELLLFEYRARSLVPVALASFVACGVRLAAFGSAPAFSMPEVAAPGGAALALYVAVGLVVGLASTIVTRAVYAVEDAFEKLPLHWMWWPAIGGAAVGAVGFFAPRTMGVGYDNIDRLLEGDLAGTAALTFCALKFASWSIALGSGTSGGTLAPLLTIGGGIGSVLGVVAQGAFPTAGVDVRVAALVGMAALFAGASRALLASVVFAFEATRQPLGLLPLLGGCTAAYLVSALGMRHSIMTEKIARRGARVVSDYAADPFEQLVVADVATKAVVTLGSDEPLDTIRARILAHSPGYGHQGFPVVDAEGRLVGLVTRRDLLDAAGGGGRVVRDVVARAPACVFADSSLREVVDHMVREGVGRLPVVSRSDPFRVVGIVSRSDVMAAHARRLASESPQPPER
ncbi:MAG: chloride channel protein [Polyangiaceae bacterium]|nr:chloride channel protein [Polyangiaceae bacterium]